MRFYVSKNSEILGFLHRSAIISTLWLQGNMYKKLKTAFEIFTNLLLLIFEGCRFTCKCNLLHVLPMYGCKQIVQSNF